jgi:hypothetical protein
MIRPHVEYVGFSTDGVARSYQLRATLVTGEMHDFVLVIRNEAFLGQRVRYQDGPEICYLRLQRELTTCGEGLPPLLQSVSDEDLAQYRQAHATKQAGPRPSSA